VIRANAQNSYEANVYAKERERWEKVTILRDTAPVSDAFRIARGLRSSLKTIPVAFERLELVRSQVAVSR